MELEQELAKAKEMANNALPEISMEQLAVLHAGFQVPPVSPPTGNGMEIDDGPPPAQPETEEERNNRLKVGGFFHF